LLSKGGFHPVIGVIGILSFPVSPPGTKLEVVSATTAQIFDHTVAKPYPGATAFRLGSQLTKVRRLHRERVGE